MNKLYLYPVFLFTGLMSAQLTAQQKLGLQKVIAMAQSQSIAASQAENRKTTQYWEWRTFKAQYRPQITWSSTLPGFTRATQEVIQDDGSIEFQAVSQSNVRTAVSLSQQIAATGGTVFLSSSLQRFDNLEDDITRYNSAPIQLGLNQPIFEFNPLKWDKKTEPLRYQESLRAFNVNMEEIALQTIDLYFMLIIAQMDLQIAQTNLRNTDTIYQIALKKYELGKTSDNDLLQLKLENLKAAKSLAAARQDVETAFLQLRLLTAYQGDQRWELALPQVLPNLRITNEKALEEAFANRPEGLAIKRRTIEASRDVAAAKGNTGFAASLQVNIGLNKSADQLREAYQSPENQQGIQLTLTAPIIDWGRTKAQVATAEANQLLVLDEIKQDQLDFEQNVMTQIRLIKLFENQVQLNYETDSLAQNRYQIAQDRYILGDLSITDLSIALQEKDQAKRDYLQSLWNYWQSYFQLRALTLFDFATYQKINYIL